MYFMMEEQVVTSLSRALAELSREVSKRDVFCFRFRTGLLIHKRWGQAPILAVNGRLGYTIYDDPSKNLRAAEGLLMDYCSCKPRRARNFIRFVRELAHLLREAEGPYGLITAELLQSPELLRASVERHIDERFR